MLLRRLRDNAPFTPMNGVRPLPPVDESFYQVRPLPPVDDSFYQVRPLPPVVNPDAVRPLPPVDNGVRLAGGFMPDAMADYSSEGGFTPPKITFPDMMDEYADQSRTQMLEPGRLDVADAAQPVPSISPVPPVVEGGVADYNNERGYEPRAPQKGLRGVAQKLGRGAMAPATRVGSLAKMLYQNTTNPIYDEKTGQYRGLTPPTLPVNDIEKMAQRDFIENYYPRRRA